MRLPVAAIALAAAACLAFWVSAAVAAPVVVMYRDAASSGGKGPMVMPSTRASIDTTFELYARALEELGITFVERNSMEHIIEECDGCFLTIVTKELSEPDLELEGVQAILEAPQAVIITQGVKTGLLTLALMAEPDVQLKYISGGSVNIDNSLDISGWLEESELGQAGTWGLPPSAAATGMVRYVTQKDSEDVVFGYVDVRGLLLDGTPAPNVRVYAGLEDGNGDVTSLLVKSTICWTLRFARFTEAIPDLVAGDEFQVTVVVLMSGGTEDTHIQGTTEVTLELLGGTGVSLQGTTRRSVGDSSPIDFSGLSVSGYAPSVQIRAYCTAAVPYKACHATVSTSFLVADFPPVVSGVARDNGPTTAGQVITISGANLGDMATNQPTVSIGGNECTVQSVSATATSMTCLYSSPGLGSFPIAYSTPRGGSHSETVNFLFMDADITSIAPTYAAAAGGAMITIAGSGFGLAAVDITDVQVGGSSIKATCTWAGLPDEIQCASPEGLGAGPHDVVVNSLNGAVTLASAYSAIQDPAISNVAPPLVEVGGDLTLTISFANPVGYETGDILSVSAGTIGCNVDAVQTASALPNGIVCVLSPGGGAQLVPGATYGITVDTAFGTALLAGAFSVYDAPQVSAVAPGLGVPEMTAAALTLTGTDLGLDAGDVASVTLGGSACAFSYVSDGELDVTTAATLAAGDHELVVTTTSGGPSNAFVVTLHAPPSVTSITPSSGPLAGGATVVIDGERLGLGGIDVTTIALGGTSCTMVDVSLLPNRVTCTTATHGMAEAVSVTVTTNSGGSGSLVGGYEYNTKPYVLTVTPDGGPTVGGTPITVTGLYLGTDATLSSVTIGGFACTDVAFVTDNTEFTCNTGDAGTMGDGAYPVIVTVGPTTEGVSEVRYTYSGIPFVTLTAPDFVPAGEGDFVVTISGGSLGSNIGDIVSVDVGGVACTDFADLGLPAMFSCQMNDGLPAGFYDVLVTTNSGGPGQVNMMDPEAQVEVALRPYVVSKGPMKIPAQGGATVTLGGHNLGAADNLPTITIGGVPCTLGVMMLPSQVSCTNGADAAGGNRQLVITTDTPGGDAIVLGGAFTTVARPTVDSVVPDRLAASDGGDVVITGTGFTAAQGTVTSVTVGGQACSIVGGASSTSVTCTVVAGSPAASLDVIVTTTYGGTSAPGSASVQRVASPSLDTVSPSTGPSSSPVALTVNGSFIAPFASDIVQVLVGGVDCPVVGTTGTPVTELTCDAPARPAGGSVSFRVVTAFGSRQLSAAFEYIPCSALSGTDCGSCISHQATCGWCAGTDTCGTAGDCSGWAAVCRTVTSIAPLDAPLQGGQLTVTGTGFSTLTAGTTKCRFGGAGGAETAVTIVSDGQITCQTPPSPLPGFVDVDLVNTGGELVDPAQVPYSFEFYDCSTEATCAACAALSRPACGWCAVSDSCSVAADCAPQAIADEVAECPAVGGVLPADGVPTSGNFVVTVTGTNFLETPRVLRCVFYSGDLVFFESRATRVSATELTCLTPVIGNGADLWTEVLVTGNDQPYGGTAPVNVTYYDCTSGILTCQDCAAAGDLCGWCSTPTSASCLGNTASCPVWETCSAAETTAAPGGNSDDGLVVDESPTDSSMVPLLIGAGAGGCCLILLVALLVFFCCCRRGGNKFGDEFGTYATDLDDDATVVAKQDAMGDRVRNMLNGSKTKQLGRGAHSKVFAAHSGKEMVVLKVIVNVDKRARDEYHREVRSLSRLLTRDHPGIVQLKFYVQANPTCVALEYCPNGDLKGFMKKKGASLSAAQRVVYAHQIACGLTVIHHAGIAHLDMKTANVLVDNQKNLKIADFGISRLVNNRGGVSTSDHIVDSQFAAVEFATATDDLGSSGSGVGGPQRGRVGSVSNSWGGTTLPDQTDGDIAFTPQYVDPQRIVHGADVDLRASDMFSFAMVVRVLATNEEPFAGQKGDDVIALLRKDPSYRLDLPDRIDDTLRETIVQCWAEHGEDRPAALIMATFLAERLEEVYGTTPDAGYDVRNTAVDATVTYPVNGSVGAAPVVLHSAELPSMPPTFDGSMMFASSVRNPVFDSFGTDGLTTATSADLEMLNAPPPQIEMESFSSFPPPPATGFDSVGSLPPPMASMTSVDLRTFDGDMPLPPPPDV